jgi:hypothetical protein
MLVIDFHSLDQIYLAVSLGIFCVTVDDFLIQLPLLPIPSYAQFASVFSFAFHVFCSFARVLLSPQALSFFLLYPREDSLSVASFFALKDLKRESSLDERPVA